MTQQDAKHIEFGVSLTFLEVAENFLSHGLLHSKKYFFLSAWIYICFYPYLISLFGVWGGWMWKNNGLEGLGYWVLTASLV